MSNFIGVKSYFDTLAYRSSLKGEALIFSQIAIPFVHDLFQRLHQAPTPPSIGFINELEWLFDRGIIFDSEEIVTNAKLPKRKEVQEYAASMIKAATGMRKFMRTPDYELLTRRTISGDKFKPTKRRLDLFTSRITNFAKDLGMALESQVRLASVQLRELHQMDAYPILTGIHSLKALQVSKEEASHATKSDILKIVVKALPVPNDLTPWEQIFEYRSDPESISKFLALRNWMNEVARAKLTPLEIEQKLEYQIDQYQQHLKLHKLKTNVGALETIVVASAEFLEDLVKCKWGKLAKGLFSLKHRRLALMEGELTAPGNEIAYIVRAKEIFS